MAGKGPPEATYSNSAPAGTQSTEVLLVFRGNLMCCSLCPLPLVLAVVTTEQSSVLCSLCTLLPGVHGHWWDSPNILFSMWKSPSSHSLPSQEWLLRPSIIFTVLRWTLSSMPRSPLYWGAQNRTPQGLLATLPNAAQDTIILLWRSHFNLGSLGPLLQSCLPAG